MIHKLSYRLPVYIMLVISFLTLIFIPVFIFFQKSMFIDVEKRRMSTFADGLTEVLPRADVEAIWNYIEENEAEEYRIRILDEKGQVVYNSSLNSNNNESGKEISPKHQFLPETYSEDAFPVEFSDVRSKPTYKIIELKKKYTIEDADYYVYVRESLKNIDAFFSYSNKVLLYIIFFYTVIVCFLSILGLKRYFINPIEELSKVTEKVAGEDYSVRYTGRITEDEIGTLAHNVNYMVDAIQENINSLNNYNFLLNRQVEILNEQEELRKKMIARLTHELKTPLAIISSQVEMIYALENEARRQEYYNHAMEEIQKMSNTVTSVLNSSVYEQMLLQGDPVDTDLSKVIDTLFEKCRNYVESHNIQFSKEIEPSCVKYLYPEHTEHVFNNYLTNAIKNTGNGGRISVNLRKSKEAVRLSVYNFGRPILEKDGEKIWLEFARSGRPGTKEGAGLGLYIVKEISILYQTECGYINRDNGVEFWFDFVDLVRKKPMGYKE